MIRKRINSDFIRNHICPQVTIGENPIVMKDVAFHVDLKMAITFKRPIIGLFLWQNLS